MDTSNDDKAQADVGLLGEVPYRSDPLQAAKLATLAALSGLDEHIRSTQKVSFQARVNAWMLNCFGAEITADIKERPHRFLEEALELVQSVGTTKHEAMQLVDYVFSRPTGDQHQEVGGVMLTLASLCSTMGVNMMIAGEAELGRVSTPEMIAKLQAKNAAKYPGSPLPGFATEPDNPPFEQVAEALRAASNHLDYCGYGDRWERECAEADGLGDKIAAAIGAADAWETDCLAASAAVKSEG